ncbi:MAG: gamma carbonic anhydrase family protein [Lachnospiraceae bacterium]|nr:gamma carbonic anhydrase family protein [Lachnospiraceae bacterium]
MSRTIDKRASVDPSVYVADGARIIGNAVIGADSSVWYNAVIRADSDSITIGMATNIQDNAVLHTDEKHPIRIGSYVTVGHGAILHGCTIGDNSIIGMGAIIMNDAVIGNNCIIGAGALITQGTEIPDGWMAYGSPAKPVKKLDLITRSRLSKNAKIYVKEARQAKEETEESEA